jgi:hypothetical protein
MEVRRLDSERAIFSAALQVDALQADNEPESTELVTTPSICPVSTIISSQRVTHVSLSALNCSLLPLIAVLGASLFATGVTVASAF